jgi:hypothetical protein
MSLFRYFSAFRPHPPRLVLGSSLATVVSAYLLYSAVLAVFSVASFPVQLEGDVGMPFLSDKPLGEDGFYMLTVSWSIAEGEGIRYNGKRTTGIQPLATFVYAILAKISQACGWSKWTFLRVVLIFGSVTLVAFSELVHQIARELLNPGLDDTTLRLVVYALTLTNLGLHRAFTYGLETGLYLCLVAYVVLFTVRRDQPLGVQEALKLGLLGGLAGLARIDFPIVFGVFLALSCLTGTMRLGPAMVAGGTLSAMMAPWLFFVHRVSGSWIPSSGGAQLSAVSPFDVWHRTWEMVKACIGHLTPWIYTAQLDGLTLLAILSLVVAALLLRINRGDAQIDVPKGFRYWALATATLIVVYAAFFWTTHFYTRYISPVALSVLPWMAARFAAMVSRRPLLAAGLAGVCLVTFAAGAGVSLHSGRFVGTHAMTAGFIHDHFQRSDRVGAFQSGVVGFFHENTVNLDGKMDHRALQALRSDEIGAYIDSEKITVLVEWRSVLEHNLSREYLASWNACPGVIRNDSSVCLTRPLAVLR